MQTAFTTVQLADPQTTASYAEIRKCVHCGFCTATCATYVLLGDERDSPRGRIELTKAMLEDSDGADAARAAARGAALRRVARPFSFVMEAIGLRSLAALLRLVPPSPRSGERACLRGPWDTARSGGAAAGLRGAGHGAVHPRGGDPDAADAASRARDILEFIGEVGLPPVTRPGALSVAYHAPCSLQHGHGIKAGPAELLAQAGYDVYPIAEGHLCCGSAGVYNILQPQIAGRLRDRKAANIARTGGAVVAAVNVGCIAQIAPAVSMPVVHPVELLDWATGGPRPAALGARRLGKVSSRPLSIPAPLKRP